MSTVADTIASVLPEPMAKRMKSTRVIGTHSGSFHADEALGVAMLRMTDEFRDADLVRTRDQAKLDPLDIVIDVGGIYDADKNRFDHHQKGFTEIFGNGTVPTPSEPTPRAADASKTWFDTKLSSAGLVYKHFGRHIIANQTGIAETEQANHTLWIKLYKEFVEGIDAIDNGISQYDAESAGQPRYSNRTDLSSRVGWMNPRWNEASNDEILDAKFKEASKMAGEEFMNRLDYYAKAWLPARDVVEAALNKRFEVDATGQIVIFNQSVPWKEHIFSLEALASSDKETSPILYVLYPESSEKPDGKWRIQCVPKAAEGFENRKSLPESWRGVRDEQLSQVAGIDGCIFVHMSGFIGGNATKQGAIDMARKALIL
ncbi:hypothetical protein QFC21_005761 [Naganishia friedmannii]|uniref:Uncharacterized protein n=1 Tax=Naganishia friedmannii TaxID=89922 RepID=A0ACC2V731_9TREE|nr:hypothetical protein QFC21_005761 [Naganishia friedmannii]